MESASAKSRLSLYRQYCCAAALQQIGQWLFLFGGRLMHGEVRISLSNLNDRTLRDLGFQRGDLLGHVGSGIYPRRYRMHGLDE